MKVDVQPAVIQSFLQVGGMPSSLSEQCAILPVKEPSASVSFRIESPQGTFYLKFHDAQGARGAYYLKYLAPMNHPEIQEHAEKRRKWIRKMLDFVVEQRSSLVPAPSYFDLQKLPMALQKLRGQKEGVVAELQVTESVSPQLSGMVATLWTGLNIQHISANSENVWDPTAYSYENVFRCMATIGEFQKKAEQFITLKIQQKVAAGKGSPEQVLEKLTRKLQHEQRALMGYEALTQEFFSALGLWSAEGLSADRKDALQRCGENVLLKVEQRLGQDESSSIAELRDRFLQKVSIPPEHAALTFQGLVYAAERERFWTASERREAKQLDQLQQASNIAHALIGDPSRILSLIEDVLQFKNVYESLQQLPQAIVPQDAHPFNFFTNQDDGSTTMLDLEDLSMGVRFADLSTVYIFKILRAAINQKITKSQATEYLHAAINGYNSEVSTPLTQKELAMMANYTIGVFLNFLPQFGIILRLDPAELDAYNLGMSLEAFTRQFTLLKENGALFVNLYN